MGMGMVQLILCGRKIRYDWTGYKQDHLILLMKQICFIKSTWYSSYHKLTTRRVMQPFTAHFAQFRITLPASFERDFRGKLLGWNTIDEHLG